MAKQINCQHCGGKNLRTTNTKGIMECKDCSGCTDVNGNRFAARVVGTTIGALLTGITLGLLPDEVEQQIADTLGDFIGDHLA
jgi:phage FluMu protein Com